MRFHPSALFFASLCPRKKVMCMNIHYSDFYADNYEYY